MRTNEAKADVIWHFENPEYITPYCREIDKWWTGYSVSNDARGTQTTANQVYVTCPKCLRKMKENGIRNIFTKKEMEILKKVQKENHIFLPEDQETAEVCFRLSSMGLLAEVLGFKDDVIFYETTIGNNSLNAVLAVYGEEYK